MSSGYVLFHDDKIKSLHWPIDNFVNEIIGLTSAFEIAGLIAVVIDAIMVSTLVTKNSLKSFASWILLSCFGSSSTSRLRSNFKVAF